MQKRDLNKSGGSGGGSAAPAPKRGRPFGSTSGSAAAFSAADSVAPSTLLGPSLQVHTSFAASDQNNKRIVLALQSGLKSELTWALNTLTLLSFKEKEDMRKDSLAKISGLLDALLQVIDDWRDIALPKELQKTRRVRTLGSNSLVTGFGYEYEALGSNDNVKQSGLTDASAQKNVAKFRPSEWWYDEDGLFNLDDEGRAEKQQCAVAASNIIRNFSFMPENEVIMAGNRHCLETVFQCIEDHTTEDEELVTNALETIVNLAPLLDLRIFSSSKPSYIKITEKRAVQAIMGMLGSAVKAWHCAAAELLGRLIINPDNEPFLLPFFPQIHKRLVDLMSSPALDAQAAAVGALYNLAEVNMDCRLKLASERWAVDRLLRVIRAPHPVPEVCRKAAMILESLVSEPQNKALLLAYENAFAEILFSDTRYSDTFARILYELTSRPSNKFTAARGVWGM
ncbi:armadillo repeat-containing protein LFR isoform X1 [Populus alba x Populus x berolinensis]|uniref:Armadillo repeat-containing protein LFR isoform X1 n=1 Tax=Populus alba x Populus x berolinensis TaxID=444605 RepID=A0AAD6MN05_9ROSI|nr:armadillo repeat-containing protein LFR isoform X1 [Populus alba x Populus x berolinensis]KAJ6988558.1 armadillo repeat-containing protein LFR isoform X1 [Populus alba x Populus x berolinensis]